MPVLEKGDVRVPFETRGESGEWITLVNGYTRSLTDFRGMSRFLAERGWRVLTFDNRGAGQAECPPGFGIEDISADIADLLAQVGATSTHVVGISYGGAIAATLAASRPELVRSLVLVSAPVTTKSLSPGVETRGPSRDPRRMQADLMRYFSPRFLEKNQMLVQGFLRQMAKIFQELDTSLGARAQRDSMEELDLTPSLSSIKAPTLILHGQQDRIVATDSARTLNSAISGSQLELLPDIGHLLLAEMPLKFYERVDEFCRSTDGK